jgi:hypothetical protein
MARLLDSESGRRGEQHFSTVLEKSRSWISATPTVRELACLTPSREMS